MLHLDCIYITHILKCLTEEWELKMKVYAGVFKVDPLSESDSLACLRSLWFGINRCCRRGPTLAHRWPIVGPLLAHCWHTVGPLLAHRWPSLRPQAVISNSFIRKVLRDWFSCLLICKITITDYFQTNHRPEESIQTAALAVGFGCFQKIVDAGTWLLWGHWYTKDTAVIRSTEKNNSLQPRAGFPTRRLWIHSWLYELTQRGLKPNRGQERCQE